MLVPGFPYKPGQVIHLTGMTHELQQWVKDGIAEVVRDAEPELAVVGPKERAVTRRRVRA